MHSAPETVAFSPFFGMVFQKEKPDTKTPPISGDFPWKLEVFRLVGVLILLLRPKAADYRTFLRFSYSLVYLILSASAFQNSG